MCNNNNSNTNNNDSNHDDNKCYIKYILAGNKRQVQFFFKHKRRKEHNLHAHVYTISFYNTDWKYKLIT